MDYNYHEAVSRNIGWISEWEQLSLRTKKIAIAGMGGVGGAHLIALARLGIGQFHIADLDDFGMTFRLPFCAHDDISLAEASTKRDQLRFGQRLASK